MLRCFKSGVLVAYEGRENIAKSSKIGVTIAADTFTIVGTRERDANKTLKT